MMGPLRGEKPRHCQWKRLDIALVLLLGLGQFAWSWQQYARLRPVTIEAPVDHWFDGDSSEYYGAWLYRLGNHTRSDKHPLLSLLTYPAVFALERIVGGEDPAVRSFTAATAAAWLVLMFVVLRLMGFGSFDALAWSLLSATSAAAFAWLAVPESFVLGAISLQIVLIAALTVGERSRSAAWDVGCGLVSLSAVGTNWVSGLLFSFSRGGPSRMLRAAVATAMLGLCLWGIQKAVFPSSRLPFHLQRGETRALWNDLRGSSFAVVRAEIAHSMVMPRAMRSRTMTGSSSGVSVQGAAIGSGAPWAWFAVIGWCGFLAAGAHSLAKLRERRVFRSVLVGTLTFEVILHLVFGWEAFLYGMHFVTLLVPVASLAGRTLGVCLTRCVLLLTIMTNGLNNAFEYERALSLARSLLAKVPAAEAGVTSIR